MHLAAGPETAGVPAHSPNSASQQMSEHCRRIAGGSAPLCCYDNQARTRGHVRILRAIAARRSAQYAFDRGQIRRPGHRGSSTRCVVALTSAEPRADALGLAGRRTPRNSRDSHVLGPSSCRSSAAPPREPARRSSAREADTLYRKLEAHPSTRCAPPMSTETMARRKPEHFAR